MKKDWKPSPEEQMLVEQSIAQDRKAQYQVYQKYSKAMFNICLRILNDWGEAEDALQDAFVKVFKNIEQFNGTSTLGAWIKRIVVNQCINQLKKKRLETDSLEETHFQEPVDYHETEQDLELDVSRVREAIQELPDGFRVVFSLYLLEGYDHQEIAEILDISVSTSKSQYSRAKAKLREMLSES